MTVAGLIYGGMITLLFMYGAEQYISGRPARYQAQVFLER